VIHEEEEHSHGCSGDAKVEAECMGSDKEHSMECSPLVPENELFRASLDSIIKGKVLD